MRRGAVLGLALAAWGLLPGCGAVSMVLSSVDSGLEAGALAAPDAAFGGADGQASQDGASEQGPDVATVPEATVPDAELDGGIDVLGDDAQPTSDDGSDGSDGSACATFQPEFVWTPTSASFECDTGTSSNGCGSGLFQFSDAARTLSGDACIAGNRSRWLVHLTSAQVDAIVASVSSIQTVCERPWCYRSYTSLVVHGADASDAAINYEACTPFADFGFPTIDGGGPYANNSQTQNLVRILFDLIVAACDPDAGGGDPATCVPIDQDGAVLDAAGSD